MLGKLLKATAKTVIGLPLAAVSDVFTMGGTFNDNGSELKRTVKSIFNDLDEMDR